MTYLMKFAKRPAMSAAEAIETEGYGYDGNGRGYFESGRKAPAKAAAVAAKPAKDIKYGTFYYTADEIIAKRDHAVARLGRVTDQFGKIIVAKEVEELNEIVAKLQK